MARHTLLVLPVGAVEQHGPHLPLGTDYLIVEWIARAAAERAAAAIPVLIAPTLPYGASHHHLSWGASSLGTWAFLTAISDLVRSLFESGFRRIFLLNGHGGNDLLLQQVARDSALQHSIHVAAGSYWTIAWDALVGAGAAERGWLPGHAGTFETSLVLALRPELVAERPHRDDAAAGPQPSFYGPYRSEHPGWWQSIDGYTDSPDRATAAEGERYLAVIADAVAAALIEFYRSAQGERDGPDR
jgi:creatinine amidohydrolase